MTLPDAGLSHARDGAGATGRGGANVTASMADFDQLAKGDAAPDWLLAGIINAWGYDPASTTCSLITVSENATFVVRVGGSPVAVVRVARPGYMAGTAAFESESAWVRAIASSGVARVPEPLSTVTGATVAQVSDASGTVWTCVSSRWIVGEILEDVTDPVPHYRGIGQTTALMHEQARSWAPPKGFERHAWELTDMVGPVCRWGQWQAVEFGLAERSLLELAQNLAITRVLDVERNEWTWGLIHADLRPSNIMTGPDGLTVIDFDDCGYGWTMYDFAASLTFMEHTMNADVMAKEWMAGYTDVRPLSPADMEVGCAWSMIRRLQMLGWTTTHRQDALPPTLWNSQQSGTVAVAERYVRSRTWLLN